MRRFVSALRLLPVLLLVCVTVLLFVIFYTRAQTLPVLKVTFLDVGQGDATFIESPKGAQVLIDGGRNRAVLKELDHVLGFFDRSIDVVVATHPDTDHIGGLIEVLNRYVVRTVLMTENESDTPEYQAFIRAVKNEGAQILFVRRGQVFDLGDGAAGSTTLAILFPDRDPATLESNTSSIVAQLRYGTNEFMFTGDSPSAIEEYLVSQGSESLRSDVLKVGHHGSRTSSSESFVSAVDPAFAVISVGKDNSYGHPHKEVVERFALHDVSIKNTADEGSILVISDGFNVSFK